jgi:hypothetical protein
MLLVVASCLAAPAFAQTTTATVQGVVDDSGGAPSATVTARREHRLCAHDDNHAPAGSPAMRAAGPYTLTISSPDSRRARGLVFSGSETTLDDARVGGVTETVTVREIPRRSSSRPRPRSTK